MLFAIDCLSVLLTGNSNNFITKVKPPIDTTADLRIIVTRTYLQDSISLILLSSATPEGRLGPVINRAEKSSNLKRNLRLPVMTR